MARTTLSISAVWERTSHDLPALAGRATLIALVTIGFNDALAAMLKPAMQGEVAMSTRLAAFSAIVVGALWSIFGQLALTALALDGRLATGAALARGAARLPAMVGSMLILGIGLAIVALPLLGGIVAGAVDLQAQPPVMPAWYLGCLLLLMLVVIACWAKLLVMTPLVVEGAGPVAAIRIAWARSAGHFWKLFGVVLLYMIVAGLITLAVGLAGGALFALVLGAWGGLAAAIATAIVTALISMTAMVFIAKLHIALSPPEAFA